MDPQALGMSEGINMSGLFAGVYWAFIVSLLLAGISLVQGYIYFLKYDDRLFTKLSAGFMLVLDIASSMMVAEAFYYYLIPHFGSLIPLNSFIPVLSAECILSAFITRIAQLYFARQLYTVSQRGKGAWIAVVVTILALIGFAFSITCAGIMIVQSHSILANKSTTFQIIFGFAKGFDAITDIVATVAMCVHLASARTGMIRTDALIKSLMAIIINRGVLVTVVQIVTCVIFFAAPNQLYWMALHMNLTKLYVNTFFAMLNARSRLNNKNAEKTSSGPGTLRNRTMAFNSMRKHSQFTGFSHTGSDIDIEGSQEKSTPSSMPTITTVVVSDA